MAPAAGGQAAAAAQQRQPQAPLAPPPLQPAQRLQTGDGGSAGGMDGIVEGAGADGGADDGFTLVRRRGRGRWADGATGGTASPAKAPQGSGGAATAATAKEDDLLAAQWNQDAEYTEEEEALQDEAVGDESRPAHEVLRDELAQLRGELRDLKKMWPEGHWTVEMAHEKVRMAEDAWRSEKPAAQPSRTLWRAEQALRKSERREDGLVQQIRKLDAEYEAKRSAIEDALADERAKLRDCRQALSKAQAEVGAEARRHGAGTWEEDPATAPRADGAVVKAAVASLEADVAPKLAALVDGLESCGAADEIKQCAHAIMAKLHSVHGDLQQAAEGGGGGYWGEPSFDMADGDSLPDLTEQERGEWAADWHLRYGPPRHQGWGGWYGYADDWGCRPYHSYHGGQGCWHHGDLQARAEDADAGGERPNKRGKITDDSAMEEQAYADMAVPEHMSAPAGSGDPAARVEAAAGGAAAATGASEAETRAMHTEVLRAKVAEFRAAARERSIDVADVDFANVTEEQLEELAKARFGAA
jgi:nuclear transport factor 2 (NTF2) superfamily protein